MELDTFNSAIIGFPYSPVDARDKPCPISVSTLSSNDNKLKQSAGQMLVLLKILTFLIDTIGENDYTQMLLKLLEIVKILFSPIVALSTLSRLKLLIEQHLKHFKRQIQIQLSYLNSITFCIFLLKLRHLVVR